MDLNHNNNNNEGDETTTQQQPPPPRPIPMWLMEHCQRLEANLEDFTNLNLNIRQLNPNMMSSLCSSLKSNHTILTLNMVSTFSTQPYPNKCLVEFSNEVLALPSSSKLQKLHLSYNRLTSIGENIGLALQTNTTLTELYLDYNYLNSQSANAIAEGLTSNTCLRILKLSSNRIDDDGGQALGDALCYNKTLLSLSLSRNPNLGLLTGKSFLNAFVTYNNTTLTLLEINEGNPHIPNSSVLEYYAQANKSGRYLIHQHHQSNNQNHQNHHVPLGIWPLVFEKPTQQFQPSISHMFLKERPDLVTVVSSATTTSFTTTTKLK